MTKSVHTSPFLLKTVHIFSPLTENQFMYAYGHTSAHIQSSHGEINHLFSSFTVKLEHLFGQFYEISVHLQSIYGEISAHLVHLWQNHHIYNMFVKILYCFEILLAEERFAFMVHCTCSIHFWRNQCISCPFMAKSPYTTCIQSIKILCCFKLLLAEKGSPLWAKPVLRRLVPLINTATLPWF